MNRVARRDPVDPHYLRKLIREAGLTQKEAAQLIGVDHRTMKRYLGDNPDAISSAGVLVLEHAAKRGQIVPLPPAGS